MRRRPLRWLGILLAMGLVLALAFPTSHYVFIGLLQKEAFYDGKPTSYWVSALKKRGYFGTEGPPRDVGNILSKAGAAAVPVVVDMLQEEDDDVRLQALLALAAMKPGEAAAAATALERTLLNAKTTLHRQLGCLALVKANEEAAIRWFIGMLERGETKKSRVLAATALGELGPKAREAVPALIEALQDMDRDIRVAAAMSLGYIGPAASTAVPHLGRAVKDSEAAIRSTAAYALGWIGPAAKAAVPVLIEALKDKDEHTRINAAQALGRIGPVASTVTGLIAALQDESFQVRRYAAYALAAIVLAQAQVP